MPQRDCAAVDVESVEPGCPALRAPRNALNRKGFVDLEQVNVGDCQSRPRSSTLRVPGSAHSPSYADSRRPPPMRSNAPLA